MLRAALAFSLLALAACGDGYTDAGSGSESLRAVVDVVYDSSQQSMYARAEITRDGAFVPGVTARLVDDGSSQQFELFAGDGVYEARIDGAYRRKLELVVLRGTDEIKANLEGPGAHIISSPDDGETVPRAANAAKITWTTGDGVKADAVTITDERTVTDATRTVTVEDKGSTTFPFELPAGDDTLQVKRTNSVTLDGGISGSAFSLSYLASRRIKAD